MGKRRLALCLGGSDYEYQSPMLSAITERCKELGFQLGVFSTLSNKFINDREDVGSYNIYNLINFEKFEGVIIIPRSIKNHTSVESIVSKALACGLPVVSADDVIPGCYSVRVTDEHSIEAITDHVIEVHGVRDLCFISGIKGIDVSKQREDAFRRSLEKHSITVDDDMFLWGDFVGSHAVREMQKYYEKKQRLPRAFICANDAMAVDLALRLAEMGFVVPDDIIVTGVDGINVAMKSSLTITTAKFDYVEMGIKTVDIMAEILEGKCEKSGVTTLESQVHFQSSCGCKAVTRHDDTSFIRMLYSRIEDNDFYSEWVLNMIEKINCSAGFDETLSYVSDYFGQRAFGEKFWVCICDDYLKEVNEPQTLPQFRTEPTYSGYSQTMLPVIVRTKEQKFNVGEFDISEMLPSFSDELDAYDRIMFFPLHFLDKTIGYVASSFDESIGKVNFHILNSLLMNISMSMENSRNQSHLKTLIRQLSDMYVHDSMTGLYNRRGFYPCINELCDNACKKGEELMVISIDIDGMKIINDRYGHNEGDNAIVTVAKAIGFACNAGEIPARFGGDEFVIAGIVSFENHAQAIEKSIESFLELYNNTSRKPYKVIASIGAHTEKSTAGTAIDEFIKIADGVMYENKKGHKNTREGLKNV